MIAPTEETAGTQAEVEEKQLSGTFTGHNVIHVYTRFY